MSSHAQPLTQARSRAIDVQPSSSFQAAGWLVVIGTLGSAVLPALIWSLLPASIVLGYALLRTPATVGNRSERIVGGILTGLLGAAGALTIAGAAIVGGTGYEPAWLAQSSTILAGGIVAGLAALGVVVFRSGAKLTGFLVGAGLLVGLGIDRFISQLLPPGLFIGGIGFYVGMLLLAAGLLRLGHRTKAPVKP